MLPSLIFSSIIVFTPFFAPSAPRHSLSRRHFRRLMITPFSLRRRRWYTLNSTFQCFIYTGAFAFDYIFFAAAAFRFRYFADDTLLAIFAYADRFTLRRCCRHADAFSSFIYAAISADGLFPADAADDVMPPLRMPYADFAAAIAISPFSSLLLHDCRRCRRLFICFHD